MLRRAREERRRGIRDVIAEQINDILVVYVMRDREREKERDKKGEIESEREINTIYIKLLRVCPLKVLSMPRL